MESRTTIVRGRHPDRARRRRLVALMAAIALVLAACGGDDEPGEAAGDPDPAVEGAEDTVDPGDAEDPGGEDPETEDPEGEEPEGQDPADMGDPESVRYINNVAQPLVGLAGEEHGFFADAGVEVEFTEIETGTEAIAAMLGGSADFVTAADARLIQAASQDLPVVAIGIHNTGFLGNLVVRADDDDTDDMEDLVGRRLGVQVGSGVHTAWLRYLDAEGLDESDFEVVNLAVADMPAALEGNSIDGGLMWQPHASRSVEEGLTRIAMTTFDIADPVGIIYPFYLLTSREMVEERTEAVQRFVNAWVCTQQWIDDNPEEAADTLEPAFEGVDRSIVEAIFVEQRYADYQTIDEEVLEDTRGQAEKLVETGALTEVPDLDPFVDTSFVDNALSEGC